MTARSSTRPNLVALGLRAKTGRAIAIILGGPPEAPLILYKTEIKLVDPKVPATAQPYHEVMELTWPQWPHAVRKSAQAIEQVATTAVTKLITEQGGLGRTIAAVAVVGAPDRDLARIGNPHIRAHAAEGVLFRRVLELAAESNRLRWQSFSDREFDKAVSAELGRKYSSVKQRLDNLRRSVPAPWRTDEKQAAIAGWTVLHGSSPGRPS